MLKLSSDFSICLGKLLIQPMKFLVMRPCYSLQTHSTWPQSIPQLIMLPLISRSLPLFLHLIPFLHLVNAYSFFRSHHTHHFLRNPSLYSLFSYSLYIHLALMKTMETLHKINPIVFIAFLNTCTF